MQVAELRLMLAPALKGAIQRAEKAEAKERLRASFANTYPKLFFELLDAEKLDPPPGLQEQNQQFLAGLPLNLRVQERTVRNVFHSCSKEALEQIRKVGLRPSACDFCRGVIKNWIDHDCGWFGDHSKGVYVSKHADYTFFYAQKKAPVPGDEGTVLMLELVTGRVLHFDKKCKGVQPTDG